MRNDSQYDLRLDISPMDARSQNGGNTLCCSNDDAAEEEQRVVSRDGSRNAAQHSA